MAKPLLFAAGILLAIAIVVLVFWPGWHHGQEERFLRLDLGDYQTDAKRFRVEPRSGEIYFRRQEKEIRLARIPAADGCCLWVDGQREVTLNLSWLGRLGLYTYIWAENLETENNPWSFSLYLQKGDRRRLAANLQGRLIAAPLFLRLDIERGEKLVLHFSGRGIAFFATPILYRLLPNDQKRYVFVVGVDTLRGDQIGAFVAGRSLTPFIDRFLLDAASFDNAYCQSTWTIPSFASLFTSLYEFHHQVDISHPLKPELRNLVELLRPQFISFGLHGGLALRRHWGFGRGFDYYHKYRMAGPFNPVAGKTLFRQAIKTLTQAEFPDMFFFLHTYQVHDPYTPPERYLKQLDPAPHLLSADAINFRKLERTFQPVGKELRSSLLELYQAEILAFDAFFGQFITQLRRLGLYDKAMIILMSDHGEEFFEHGGWAHSHALYNEQLRVPLIIKFPGKQFAGWRSKTPVGVIDILPTVLDYYGIDYASERLDGLSLLPVLRGEKSRRPFLFSSVSTSRFIEAIPPQFAVLDERHKFIVRFPFRPQDLDFFRAFGLPPHTAAREFYDLASDSAEGHDLAEQNPAVMKRFQVTAELLRKKIWENYRLWLHQRQEPDAEIVRDLQSLGYL